jgi:uracil-DNA glycosylase
MEVNIEESWKIELKNEFDKPYFQQLISKVKSAYQNHPNAIFPKGSQIFRAFDLCPIREVRVVILGQDPYPTRGHAHGLCFSVESNVRPLPKSLQNIFKEMKEDLGVEFPVHGDLSHWASQGVLLLNSVLTVQEGLANSHKDYGWQIFTDKVIQTVSDKCENVVFILWGASAISKTVLIDQSRHKILSSVHPSPLSAHRGFFGSKPFSSANAYLKLVGKQEINW